MDLSDTVKSILAKAKTDQSVADRLQDFVAHRHQAESSQRASSDPSQQADSHSRADIDKAFQKLTDADAQTANTAQNSGPVEPAISFHNELQAGGFSVSASADAERGSFTVAINGPDGLSFLDKRFSPSGEWSDVSGLGQGLSAGSIQAGNVEYVTFSHAEAAAASVASSSDAGTVAAGAAEVHSASVTFAIDFTTGSISIVRSETTAASATARISQPGASFSTFA